MAGKIACTLLLVATFLPRTARAAELTLMRKGLFASYVFVDGEYQGKLKKKGLVLQLPDGPHEIATAADRNALFLRCVTEMEGGTMVVSSSGCPEATWSQRSEHTVLRGSRLKVSVVGVLGLWIFIDGSPVGHAIPPLGATLNLAPGGHVFVFADALQQDVKCQGKVSLSGGETDTLVISTDGCLGFDS